MLHQIITILSTKGGVGKTTLAANLGGFLSMHGYRVLMVDADFQPALSSYYSILSQSRQGLTAFFSGALPDDCISNTEYGDLVVSDDPQGLLQQQAMALADGRLRFRQQLEQLRDSYDFILVDTQGADGALQEAAALAADVVVSPLQVSALSIQELQRGTLSLVARLSSFEAFGLKVPLVKGVLWGTDGTRDCSDIAVVLREMAESEVGGFDLLGASVSHSVAWRESATQQIPVSLLGAKRKKAVNELEAVVGELLPEVSA